MRRFLLILGLLAACDSPSGNDDTSLDVRGVWTYDATQTTPALDIAGAVQITEQTGNTFTGTAAFTETDVQGTQRERAGAVSGRLIGGDVVDMDVYLDLQVRRHVARITADSMSGTWSLTDAASVSGDFTMRRVP